jgi:hypothetical protein
MRSDRAFTPCGGALKHTRPKTRRKLPRRARGAAADADAARIDALYGLEPIFEPSAAEAASTRLESARFESVQCPYCGEIFDAALDLSAPEASYIEDCQVCCQPIEFNLEVNSGGTRVHLRVQRTD